MKTIKVIIDDANVEVSTSGFAGAECLKATAELEKALGAKTSDVKTSEYHKPARAGAPMSSQQGS